MTANGSYTFDTFTLDGYAARKGVHPNSVRKEYLEMMRFGRGLELPQPIRSVVADGVHKFCLEIAGQPGKKLEIESVIIPMSGHQGREWNTLCVSSQIGCKMGCTFCETGRMGLIRNLTSDEIVLQRLVAREMLREARKNLPPERGWRFDSDGIRNIVFMGMGEPFDNFDELSQAIRVLSDPNGMNIPHSQMTISTVGRIDGLKRLAELGWNKIRLAVSLNAARDELRDELMPINRLSPLNELQQALIDYPFPPRGYLMVEYVVIKGVNDSVADADAIADWCRPLRAAVNLIPYNPQSRDPYQTPSDEDVYRFLKRIRMHGQFVKWRRTRGREMMGACGQLGNPAIRGTRRTASAEYS